MPDQSGRSPSPGDGHIYVARRGGDGCCLSCGQPPHDALPGRSPSPDVVVDGVEYVTKDWHGLMAILRDVYPADVFTGASGDLGPRLVVLLREIDAATTPASSSSGATP